MDPVTLQQLLDAFAQGEDTGRELVASCAPENLAALIGEGREAFAAIQTASSTYSQTDVEACRQLAAVVAACDARVGALAAEQQATAEQIAGFAAQIQTPTAPVAAPPATEGGAPEGGTPAPVEPQPVAAAGTPAPREPLDLARLRSVNPHLGRNGGGEADELPEGAMIASAEVPDMPSGGSFRSIRQAGQALVRRFEALSGSPLVPLPGGGRGRYVRQGFARIPKQFPAELTASAMMSPQAFDEMVRYAGNMARLPGGSLTAAGGWCSPSQTVYDVCELESRDGMLDAPEMELPRGGLEFSPGPEFNTIYTLTGFQQTEAQAIAQDEKPCFEVPCPDFDEVRLDLIGLCINAGILQNRAFPEFVDRYIRGALVAHAHRVNASKMDRLSTAATQVDLTLVTRFNELGALAALVEAIDMQARDYRTRERMLLSAQLEVILPAWVVGVIRSDLMNRGGVDLTNVTDAEIVARIAVPNVRVQLVYDYQDSLTGGAQMGGSTPILEWPDSVSFFLYPAGTVVFGTLDVITLDAGIYDFPNLSTNLYNALFSEEGLALIVRCHDLREVTVPLCPSGAVGSAVDLSCVFS